MDATTVDFEQYVYTKDQKQVVMIVDKPNNELVVLSKYLTIEICPQEYGDGDCKKFNFKGKSFIVHIPKKGIDREEVEGYK